MQFLPLGKFTLKAQALGDLEGRDDASLDLLAGFPGSFARSPVRPPRLIEVGNKSVAFDGCRLKQSLSGQLDLVDQGERGSRLMKDCLPFSAEMGWHGSCSTYRL